MSLKGEIDVERCMAFVARQKAQVEWIALKEYWKAEPEERRIVLALYGRVVREGLEKWKNRR